MTPAEFSAFRDRSAADYAADLQKSQSIPPDEALCQARQEFDGTLPHGADTPGHFLMTIRDASDGQAVGLIWYLYEQTDGVKQVFLSDFLIYEEHRRKGYATAALAEMERLARADGCTESVLYVWQHNPAGIGLYEKCGYVPFRQMEDGMYLKKKME
jgi:GNAT superfamily N-acetyltransferase